MTRASRRAPAPEQVAGDALRALRDAARPAAAASARRFFKPDDAVVFLGVGTPAVRRLSGVLYARVKADWQLLDAVRCCDILVRDVHVEAKITGLLLLARFERLFQPGLLATCRRWFLRGYCSNWAATDCLSVEVIARLLGRHPRLAGGVESWTVSPSLWVRRAAAVALVPLARRGDALPTSYRIAERLLQDEADLVQKAAGWLLREAGKTDEDRLERFLTRHCERMSRTTLRYAIERFPGDRRMRMLGLSGRRREVRERSG